MAVRELCTGAPVLPVFIRREADGTHRVEALPPLPPPADRRPETVQAFTAACTKIIEDEIRRHPDQWLWWHKRWKSRPLADPGAATP